MLQGLKVPLKTLAFKQCTLDTFEVFLVLLLLECCPFMRHLPHYILAKSFSSWQMTIGHETYMIN